MQQNEDYVLKVLQDVGLVPRKQVDAARDRLDGQNSVVDLLVKDGIVSESDVSRSLAAQAHMDWIDLSSMVIPPDIIKQIRAEDAQRFIYSLSALGRKTHVAQRERCLPAKLADFIHHLATALLVAARD